MFHAVKLTIFGGIQKINGIENWRKHAPGAVVILHCQTKLNFMEENEQNQDPDKGEEMDAGIPVISHIFLADIRPDFWDDIA